MSPLLILSFCFFVNVIADPNDPYALGPTCGETGRTCIKTEAQCKRGQCICWNPWGYYWGKGDFKCYKPDQFGCEVKNDPQLTTYDRETEDFHFPCRYLASHVRTDLKNKHGNVIGHCTYKVYSYNGRNKGKMYALGFDVALQVVYQMVDYPPSKIIQSSFRHYATASANTNSRGTSGKNGQWSPFIPDGEDDVTYTDNPQGIKVFVDYDIRDNRWTYVAQGCGLEVTHVPYDFELRLEQRQIPGLSISVDKDNNPRFLSPDASMCLVPESAGGQLIEDIQYAGLSRQRSMLLRAFNNLPAQNHPFGVDGHCGRIGELLGNCGVAKQKEGVRNCDWILKDTQFMKCYDDSLGSGALIDLFGSCMLSWCNSRPCTQTTIAAIQRSGCGTLNKVAHLTAFMAGQRCPPEPER